MKNEELEKVLAIAEQWTKALTMQRHKLLSKP